MTFGNATIWTAGEEAISDLFQNFTQPEILESHIPRAKLFRSLQFEGNAQAFECCFQGNLAIKLTMLHWPALLPKYPRPKF